MSKLWGFGTAAVDLRITTAEYGEGHLDKLLAQKVLCLGGGAAANCLTQAARLGCETGWLGKLGNDPFAGIIRAALEAEGIDCTQIVYSETGSSPFNVAVYTEKKRRIGGFLLPNSLSELTEKELSDFAAAMQPGDWLVIEIGEIPVGQCLRLAELAKQRTVLVAVDVDLDPIRQCGADSETVCRLFETADLLIPNMVSMATLYPGLGAKELCRTMAEQFRRPTVVTAGESGAYYTNAAGVPFREPAMPVSVRDTVGAGDAFHGGLLAALAEGEELPAAVRQGTACGALNCLAFGAREGMPDREQLKRWMSNG